MGREPPISLKVWCDAVFQSLLVECERTTAFTEGLDQLNEPIVILICEKRGEDWKKWV
jgi:hypothetical protein